MSSDLKNKLDQEPLEFNTSAAWEQLSPKLDSSKRKRRGLTWWWVGGSAGVLFVVLTALYFNAENISEITQTTAVELRQEPSSSSSSSSSDIKNDVQKEFGNSDIDINGKASTAGHELVSDLTVAAIVEGPVEVGDLSSNEVSSLSQGRRVVSASGISSREISTDQREESTSLLAEGQGRESFLQEKSGDPLTEEENQLRSTLVVESQRGQESLVLGGFRGERLGNVAPSAYERREPAVGLNADVLSELDLLGLPLFDLKKDYALGPIPDILTGASMSDDKLPIKPYWQVAALAGVGYERVRSNDFEFLERTALEVRNLQLNVTRSFSKHFAVSAHAQIGQRSELYRTDFTIPFEETIYNPVSRVVGGERFGDSVVVISERRVQSDRYAKFTRLNVGAVAEYLIPTRACDFAIFGGVNYALLQRWSGSRRIQIDPNQSIRDDTVGPYNLDKKYSNQVSYVLGARVSKPIGSQLHLLFDSRVQLLAQYRLSSDSAFNLIEHGNSISVNLGLGWRF
ncbi:MAG: hypothetical protein AB8F78_03315 [Saprospiraceae bacterium]